MDEFGIDAAAAQSLVDRLPAPVKKSATQDEAAGYAEALRAIGGEVSIRSPMFGGTTAPPPAANAPSTAPIAPANAPMHAGAGARPALAARVASIAPPVADLSPKTRVRRGEVCVEHPEIDAAYYCEYCRLSRCTSCMTHVPERGHTVCQRCGNVALPYVEPHAVTTAGEYLAELPQSLLFFARKDVLILLIGTALVVWPISAMASMPANMYGFIGRAIQFGLESALLLHLIRQVARDVSDINAPDFTNIFDDIFIPTWRYVFACLPMIAAIMWTAWIAFGGIFGIGKVDSFDVMEFAKPAALFVAGFLIWPVTSLLAAMSASVLSVLNPLEWAKAIRSVGTPLLVGAPIFYGFVIFEYLVLYQVAGALLAIPVIGRFFGLLVVYMGLAVRARILGGMIIGRI